MEDRGMNVRNIIFAVSVALLLMASLISIGSENLTLPDTGVNAVLYRDNWQDIDLGADQINVIVREALQIQPYEPTEINEIVTKDLNGDSIIDLAVAVNKKCTSDPVLVAILYKEKSVVKLQHLKTEYADLEQDIQDINHDGEYELLISP